MWRCEEGVRNKVAKTLAEMISIENYLRWGILTYHEVEDPLKYIEELENNLFVVRELIEQGEDTL